MEGGSSKVKGESSKGEGGSSKVKGESSKEERGRGAGGLASWSDEFQFLSYNLFVTNQSITILQSSSFPLPSSSLPL